VQYKGKGKIVTGEPVMDQAPTGEEAILIVDKEEVKIVETCFRIAICTGLPAPLCVFPFPV
jgi:hypothetical protein